MTLLAIGSIAFDDLETPSGRRDNILGGSVSYFSLCASRFNPVRVVAVVGEDFEPEHVRVFEGRPIDLEGVTRKPGRCFHWKGVYGVDLNEARTLETHLNVFQEFVPVLPESYRHSPYLFLGNIDPVLQLDVVKQMAERPKWIALDTMNYWIEGSRPALDLVLREVDILLVNESEARSLAGVRNLIQVFRKIRSMGPRILVVKRGEYGVTVFTPEGIFSAPAFPLEEVFDPTGAGDTFAGGFLGYLAASGNTDMETVKKAALTGSVMASFAVEQFGTQNLEIVAGHDIDLRMQAFSDIIRVKGL